MLEDHSIINWILKNVIKTETGKKYQFRDYLFMFDILRDLVSLKKDVVCFKAAQIGFSTAALLATMWIAKKWGIDIIYTLPTQADVQQFAGGKINRIIAQNQILQEWVKEKDTVEQKIIGDSIIYYRGTFSQKAAMMVSSDLNVYDEVDTSKQEVVEQYSTRLQASKIKREWFFSHPSTEGNGVDRHWKKSDQKHWVIECTHCHKRQYLSWPDSFDMDKEIYICKKCGGEIYNDDRRKGEWIAKYPDRKMSGYWIPLFIAPWVTAKEIIGYYNNKSPEYFMNKVIGKPYIGGGNKLNRALLFKNLTDELITPKKDERVVIGVDTGLKIYIVAGGARGLFYNEIADDYDAIERLFVRFPKAVAVIDQGGDLIGPRKLQAKYPGRVYLCAFAEDKKTKQLVRWGENKEEGWVTADRNRCIQLVVDEFTEKRIPLQGDESDWHEVANHWDNLIRIKEMNEKTGDVARKIWKKTGQSDLSFATVYWRIGMDRFSATSQIISQDKFGGIEEAPEVLPDDTMQVDLNRMLNHKKPKDWRNV